MGTSYYGFIGRPFKKVYNEKKKLARIDLDRVNGLYIDFREKLHTFIVSKSGGGKSYLAGVLAEEMLRVMENYAVIMIDPMGIFNTLKVPNKDAELEAWNSQVPRDVEPMGMNNCEIWVPAGDAHEFAPGMYDRKFALKASEFSFGTLCYAFEMELLDPQVNLYRKAQSELRQKKRDYELWELTEFIREHAKGLHFQSQTMEALIAKLDALQELGIIARDAPTIQEIVVEGKAIVFDVSQSSDYVARILVNFFAEKLLSLRLRAKRVLGQAENEKKLIERPSWYVPPTQFVIDEAHEFLQNSPILERCIKKGRNCSLMITAISQSPDLSKRVFANITHVFVGPMVYHDDILAVRAMLPISEKPSDFAARVHELTRGTFLYYNVDKKIETEIKVRPRRTIHPASTEMVDERIYFKGTSSASKPDAEIDFYVGLEAENNENNHD